MAIQQDIENSSLNEDSRRFNGRANRRTGITTQTVVKTLGKIILIIGLIVLAFYVLTDQMARKSCNDSDLNFAPLIDKNGLLELSWDSLPTAIRTVSNLAIIEHNSRCGPLNLTSLQTLTCEYLALAYMPHSTFSFRSPQCANHAKEDIKPPCFGLRWIANRLDTYYGPFVDLEDLKVWFDSVTSSEYGGCFGKAGKPDSRSSMEVRHNLTNL